jgi:hypothetical protein
MSLQYAKGVRISLKDHEAFDEAWVRDLIAKGPSILGLGDIVLEDKERMQPKAGRLDLLFEDPDATKRYEVELMLGRVDETHIIRAIEYWDIERKRYPNYAHVAVLVAEEITPCFPNVIQLFNAAIPMIVLQLAAIEIGPNILLHFTKVLDESSLGTQEEEETRSERIPADRHYWEERATVATVRVADQCFELFNSSEHPLSLNYTSVYIGLTQGNRPNNFIFFQPRKKFVLVYVTIADLDSWLEKAKPALTVPISADARVGRLKLTLSPGGVEPNQTFLTELFRAAYKEANV